MQKWLALLLALWAFPAWAIAPVDRNADGKKTLCILTDSRSAADAGVTDDLGHLVASGGSYQITAYDNVIEMGKSGATVEDVITHSSNLLHGNSSGHCAGGANAGLLCASNTDCPSSTCTLLYTAQAKAGSVGALCDDLVLWISVNDFHTSPDSPDDGKCYSSVAAENLQHCYCDPVMSIETGFDAPEYCRNAAAQTTPCVDETACVSPTPTPNSLCPTDESNLNCIHGCINATNCTHGVCYKRPSVGAWLLRYRALLDIIDASPSHAKPVLLLESLIGAHALGCWLTVDPSIAIAHYEQLNEAIVRQYNWIDYQQAFSSATLLSSSCSPADQCYRDFAVHPSHTPNAGQPSGLRLIAQLINWCYTQNVGFGGTSCPF